MSTVKGSCHCGAVAFEAEGAPQKVYECNCSHCSRKGYLLWFMPRTQLRLATPDAPLSTYRFNKHAIEHFFCPACGCAPFCYGTDKNGLPSAAVNVRCLEDFDLAAVERVPVDGRRF